MLTLARERVSGGTYYDADLDDLPLADQSVDLVVCALALSHVPELAPTLAEFVRVLRPNGHLVIADSRGLIADTGLPLVATAQDGSFGYIPFAAAAPATTSPPRFLWVFRSGDARSRDGCTRWSGKAAKTSTSSARRPSTPAQRAEHLGVAPFLPRGDERGSEREARRDYLALQLVAA